MFAEAQKRHPALARVKGSGGFEEWKDEARKALVRVAADGVTDPLAAIIPELAVGESSGVLLDSNSLKAVLEGNLLTARVGSRVRGVTVPWAIDEDGTELVDLRFEVVD